MKRLSEILITAGILLAVIFIFFVTAVRQETAVLPPDAGDSVRSVEELQEVTGGVPDNYELTESERKRKDDIRLQAASGAIASGREGVDYIRNEVICLADSREQAEMIASAYSGVLTDFSYGIATITLNPDIITVEEAVRLGADPDSGYPPVEPNYISQIQ